MDPTEFCSEASEDRQSFYAHRVKQVSPVCSNFPPSAVAEIPICLAASVAVKSYRLAADREELVETVLNRHPLNRTAPRVR